jgi:gamma-glutamyltranspeptidase/glutathione hydrolase
MDFYKQGASTTLGGSAVATPGQMRGLEALHKRYGQLPWAKLFEDSIRLARDGAEMRGDLYAVSVSCSKPPAL